MNFYHQEQTPKGLIRSFQPVEIKFASTGLQDEIILRDLPVILLAGSRFDSYQKSRTAFIEKDVKNWSTRVELTVNPTDWLMLFGSYSQAFRPPTLAELFNDSKHYPGNNWKPNPKLTPESNFIRKAGVGLHFDNLLTNNDLVRFKTSYFNIDAKNSITR